MSAATSKWRLQHIALIGLVLVTVMLLSGQAKAASPVVEVVRDEGGVRFNVQSNQVAQWHLQIHDLSGRTLYRSGWTRASTLTWPMALPTGAPTANGVYLYSVKARRASGQLGHQVGKLVVLRGALESEQVTKASRPDVTSAQQENPLCQFDENGDGVINDNEFFDAIDAWLAGNIDDSTFFEAVDAWVNRTELDCEPGDESGDRDQNFSPEPEWRDPTTEDSERGFMPGSIPNGLTQRERASLNIQRIEYRLDEQITFTVESPPQQQQQGQENQQQYGINQDCDNDGEGDFWVFVQPGTAQAVITTGDLLIQRTVDYQQRQRQGGQQQYRIPSQCDRQQQGQRQQRQGQVMAVSFNRQVQAFGPIPPSEQRERIQPGTPVEMVAANGGPTQAIMVHRFEQRPEPVLLGLGAVGQQQTQQQTEQRNMKDKFCPPENGTRSVDIDGDGKDNSFIFPRNTREFPNGVKRVYCVGGHTFVKTWTRPDGTTQYIGKCPYVGGQNSQVERDLDGDGDIDKIVRTIRDGGGDDDTDGDDDAFRYTFDVDSGKLTAELIENGVSQCSRTDDAPTSFSGIDASFTEECPIPSW